MQQILKHCQTISHILSAPPYLTRTSLELHGPPASTLTAGSRDYREEGIDLLLITPVEYPLQRWQVFREVLQHNRVHVATMPPYKASC